MSLLRSAGGETQMKVYIKIMWIVLYIIGFTLLQPLFFSLLDMLPDFFILGVIFCLIDVFMYIFIPIKLARIKK